MLFGMLVMLVTTGVIILFHELGHLLMAKAWKMRVMSYSIGFGPKLFARMHKGTEYAVRAILAGGFIRIAGMLSNNTKEYMNPLHLPLPSEGVSIWQASLLGGHVLLTMIMRIFELFAGLVMGNPDVHVMGNIGVMANMLCLCKSSLRYA